MRTIREVLEEFKSNLDNNFAGDGKCWERQEKYFSQALAEIKGMVVPTVDELKEVLIKESNKWSGTVDGVFDLEGDQARSIHAMLKGRIR